MAAGAESNMASQPSVLHTLVPSRVERILKVRPRRYYPPSQRHAFQISSLASLCCDVERNICEGTSKHCCHVIDTHWNPGFLS